MARRVQVGTTRATRSSLRRKSTPPPPIPSEPDEEMVEVQQDQSNAPTPEEAEPEVEPEAEAEEDVATPAQTSEPAEEASIPPTPPEIQQIPRKRRGPGRPPRNRPPDWDAPDASRDDASEGGTPRRRRGRPAGAAWRGGTRGRGRGGARGQTQVTRVPIDKEGNMSDVVNDEVVMPEDAEGETKVDRDGNLEGGREYRVRTFTILGRGDRLYMLSTEPARCTGFRDSYLFFTKHLSLFKVIINDDEKHDLIERDIIPHSYKGRAIGVVTARSVFREFGAKIIVGGKRIADDYRVRDAKERGDREGELADPLDKLPGPGEAYNRNQFVAWHGASSVYHTSQPSMPLALGGRPAAPSKRKANITSANWMFEHAREASRFNASLAAMRRDTLAGVYDPHTNLMCYPGIMQPTHARWEFVPSAHEVQHPLQPPAKARRLSASTRPASSDAAAHLSQPNGTRDATRDEAQESLVNGDVVPSGPAGGDADLPAAAAAAAAPATISPLLARNYLVVDTYLATPPSNQLPAPGPDPSPGASLNPGGGPRLPQLSAQDMQDLPPECRAALAEARAREAAWVSKWGPEAEFGFRGALKIGVGGI